MLSNLVIRRAKLPGHRPGLPEKEISLKLLSLPACLVGRDPAYKAGLSGHLPVKCLAKKREF
jgi:hypothetical protein